MQERLDSEYRRARTERKAVTAEKMGVWIAGKEAGQLAGRRGSP